MHPIADRAALTDLFAPHRRGRGLLEAALHAGQGTIVGDHPTAPSLVHVQLGGFALFGGQPHSASIASFMSQFQPAWIIPESAAWERALLAPVEPLVKTRRRTRFSPAHLSLETPPSPPAGYRIVRLTADHLRPLQKANGRLWAFASLAEFSARGIGYGAFAGANLVAYAVSYAASGASIEVEVQTNPAHRRRGLAFYLCSHLLHYCLGRDIVPHWDAANPVSGALAEKLGYKKEEEYLSFRRLREDELQQQDTP